MMITCEIVRAFIVSDINADASRQENGPHLPERLFRCERLAVAKRFHRLKRSAFESSIFGER